MRKLVKGIMATFAFAIALLVCGVSKVEAALKPSINNTTVSGSSVVSFMSAENNYYVTKDGKFTVKAKTSSKLTLPMPKVYWAKLSVVTCSQYDVNVCREWSVYRYVPQGKTKDLDGYTMEHLEKGINLDLNSMTFEVTNDKEEINQQLGVLNSTYGVDNTYFVIAYYYVSSGFFNKDTYVPEVYRVVNAADVAKPEVKVTTTGGVAKFVVTSGTPINEVRYFASASKINGSYDYNAKYEENSGVEVLSVATSNPLSNNGIFAYEFQVEIETGKYYYVQATDLVDNTVTYDYGENTSVNTEQKNETEVTNDDNVGKTDIGEIILISLLVLLVISVVLVIIQKIVDRKRKLY